MSDINLYILISSCDRPMLGKSIGYTMVKVAKTFIVAIIIGAKLTKSYGSSPILIDSIKSLYPEIRERRQKFTGTCRSWSPIKAAPLIETSKSIA